MDIRTKVYFQEMDKVWHWNSISHPNITISILTDNISMIPTQKVSYPKKRVVIFKGMRKVNKKMKHPIIQPRGQNH